MTRWLLFHMLALLAGVSLAAPLSAQTQDTQPQGAQPQDGWLANPLTPWNQPGMAIPGVPPDTSASIAPFCQSSVRPPETPADEAIVNEGWVLFGIYEGGWGIQTVGGAAEFDGMCRPMGYQYFVFMNGQFAGTISPVPMNSRTTGAGRIVTLDNDHRVTANYVRYASEDPLCCPSRPSVSIEFQINETATGPVLVPSRVIQGG